MHSGKEDLPRHDILTLLDEHLCNSLASEGGARVDMQDVIVVQLHRLKGEHRRSLFPDGDCLGVRGGHKVRGMRWQRKQRDVRSGELASVLALRFGEMRPVAKVSVPCLRCSVTLQRHGAELVHVHDARVTPIHALGKKTTILASKP